MMRQHRLTTVLRLSRLRLKRWQAALAAAAEACRKAELELAWAEAREVEAREYWRAAEDDFRRRPQCPQRLMLREVTHQRLLGALDVRLAAGRALDEAEDRRSAARQALLREEARGDQFEEMWRSARRQQAEHLLSREEDEWTPRARTA